ncbi:unnamed protein product [Closterium sp. Yama58-4]|nr:unnamed protein product [Closterium sp. Yama58-4]
MASKICAVPAFSIQATSNLGAPLGRFPDMDKDAFASASSKKGWEDIERSCALMDSSNLQIDGIDLTDLLEEDDDLQGINSTSEAETSEQLQLEAALDALHVSNDKQSPLGTGGDSLAAPFVVPWDCLPPASTSNAASAVPGAASVARMQCTGSLKDRPAQPMVSSPPASNAVLRGSVDPFLMKYRLDTQASSHSFGGLPSAAEGSSGGVTGRSSCSASGLSWNPSSSLSDNNGSPNGSPSGLRTRFGISKSHPTTEVGLVDSERTGEKRGEASGAERDGGRQGGWSAQEMALENSPVRKAALSMRVKAGANPAAVEAYLRMRAQRDGAARVVRR